ncbi:MAG: HAD family hydrolase [Acidobacteria bacterium]|nr:HAD family hydrolase [Candidatus Sulfomarinibacter sp. MAG AM2]
MSSTALKALLLDLDDTLLGNPMKTFIPAYFRALTEFVTEIQPPERLIEQLLIATRKMDGGDGTGASNGEIFAEAFFPGLGVPREDLEPVFERFYAEAFPMLRPLTALRPAAPKIVEWAGQRGLQVVIATNPVFPRTAIEQRMEWAAVGVDRFEYAHVTSYENSHATKAQPAYYREILAVLGRGPEECLMVGDNWSWDMVNAADVGIPGYWIAEPSSPPPSAGSMPAGQGSLDDFFDAARSGALEENLAVRTSERLAG